jgi:hypothetical protein
MIGPTKKMSDPMLTLINSLSELHLDKAANMPCCAAFNGLL